MFIALVRFSKVSVKRLLPLSPIFKNGLGGLWPSSWVRHVVHSTLLFDLLPTYKFTKTSWWDQRLQGDPSVQAICESQGRSVAVSDLSKFGSQHPEQVTTPTLHCLLLKKNQVFLSSKNQELALSCSWNHMGSSPQPGHAY